MNTATKSLIVSIASTRTGASKHLTSQILDEMLHIIINEFCAEKSIKIPRFGSFIVHKKRKRIGRNPKTGMEAIITERNVVSFRSSEFLRRKTKNTKIKEEHTIPASDR